MNNNQLSSKGSNNNNSSASSQVNLKYKAGMYEQNKLGMNERNEVNDVSQIQTSRFSLQSELPKLDTQELLSAQKRFRAQDANDSEIIEMDMSVHGLKTATQKSLIKKIDEEFRQKELMKQQIKENQKLNYSSSIVSKISNTNGDNLNSKRSKFTNDLFSKNNYASNNSNKNQNQIIIVDSDSSLNSDRRNHMSSCKNSRKGGPNQHPDQLENLDLHVNLE